VTDVACEAPAGCPRCDAPAWSRKISANLSSCAAVPAHDPAQRSHRVCLRDGRGGCQAQSVEWTGLSASR